MIMEAWTGIWGRLGRKESGTRFGEKCTPSGPLAVPKQGGDIKQGGGMPQSQPL